MCYWWLTTSTETGSSWTTPRTSQANASCFAWAVFSRSTPTWRPSLTFRAAGALAATLPVRNGERWELDPKDDQDDGEEDGPHECGGPAADAKALADIEKYGLHVVSVMEDDEHAPFTYSIGIEQSLGMPELIVIGLKSNVAHSAINECYRQMKEGVAIAPGARVAGLLGGGFECLIGEASFEKVSDYMHWARWLYKGQPFRAYQIIWPSTTGLFPWEPGAADWFCASTLAGLTAVPTPTYIEC